MKNIMPFLFHIPANPNPLLGPFKKVEKDEFHVHIASFGYSTEDVQWMANDKLGNDVLVPSLDMVKEMHQFDTEEEALRFIAEWWKKQV